MATQQQDKQQVERDESVRQHLLSVIGEQVMHTLGQPGDLHRVQVRKLWDDRYRVNIFVGMDAGSAKVAHSYFLVADGAGKISASVPKITKQY
jgi:hypothetical protein